MLPEGMHRIRVLFADQFGFARGKYVPAAAVTGEVGFSVTIFGVGYDRDLIPAPGAEVLEGMGDLNARYSLGNVRPSWDEGTGVVIADLERLGEPLAISSRLAAQRAIELGGRYSGEEAPEDIHDVTRMAVAGLAGTGLVGVAKDNLRHEGVVPAIASGFIEIELDLETGKFEILDYASVADCGTVLHPQGLSNQVKGGAVMGLGMACTERHVYDSQIGLPANVGFHQVKPMSYLDVPSTMQWGAVDIADPQNPVGAKGVGEPIQGCASAAVLCAISDALGGYDFNRAPVSPDMVVNAAAGQPQSHGPLQVNTV